MVAKRRLWRLSFALCALFACAEEAKPLTELIVVVDSNLAVPGELDEIVVTTAGPDTTVREAVATLGPGQVAVPRYVTLAHEQGPLGPIAVRVTGKLNGSAVLERQAQVWFVAEHSLVLPLHLARQCLNFACPAAQTCTEAGCQPVAIDSQSLAAWDGHKPRLDNESDSDAGGGPVEPDAGEGVVDAGADDAASMINDAAVGEADAGMSVPDAGSDSGAQCFPRTEICNNVDDDCNGIVDEGFDFATDVLHCGGCGIKCNTQRGDVCCVGVCARTCR